MKTANLSANSRQTLPQVSSSVGVPVQNSYQPALSPTHPRRGRLIPVMAGEGSEGRPSMCGRPFGFKGEVAEIDDGYESGHVSGLAVRLR